MTVRGPFAVTLFAVLFLSLAANLLIAGFLLGRVNNPRPPGDIERIATLGAAEFPRPIRDAILTRTRERRSDVRDLVREIETSRRELVAAMRADPYDADAVEAAQEAMRIGTEKLQRIGQDIIREALAEIPAKTRAEIGDGRSGGILPGARLPRDRDHFRGDRPPMMPGDGPPPQGPPPPPP